MLEPLGSHPLDPAARHGAQALDLDLPYHGAVPVAHSQAIKQQRPVLFVLGHEPEADRAAASSQRCGQDHRLRPVGILGGDLEILRGRAAARRHGDTKHGGLCAVGLLVALDSDAVHPLGWNVDGNVQPVVIARESVCALLLIPPAATGPLSGKQVRLVHHRAVLIEHDQSIQNQCPRSVVFVDVRKADRHCTFPQGRVEPHRLRARVPSVLSLGCDGKIANGVGNGGHVQVGAVEEHALAVGQKEELPCCDGAAGFDGVGPSHRRHHWRHRSRPLDDALRIDPAVEEPLGIQQFAAQHALARYRPTLHEARERLRLPRQFLGREQTLHPGVSQRCNPHRVGVGQRLGPEPRRERDLHQQVLQVVGPPARDPLPERGGQPLHLRRLRIGGQQPTGEVAVALVLRRLRHGHPEHGRPPELHRALGEALVLRDAPRQPLQAVRRVRHRRPVEAGRAHVPVPRVPLDVGRACAFLVEPVQRVETAPSLPVRPVLPVVLERAGYRIQHPVADRAGRVLQRRVVGVGQRDRVRGSGGGLLDVQAEKVIVGPP